jgi:translation initiation factor IF-2
LKVAAVEFGSRRRENLPVRIYTLAKELKLDSKVLADICTSAGVTGKGSALASLTDEEVERVKSFISNRGGSPRASTATLSRPSAAGDTALEAAPIRREDYVAPGGVASEKVPALGDVGPKPSPLKRKPVIGDGNKPLPRTAPTVKLAAMPTAQQPVEPPKSQEPAPQKPDLKLPLDAIRASRAGSKPLSDHLKKHEAKKRLEQSADQVRPAEVKKTPLGKDRPRKVEFLDPAEVAAKERAKKGRPAAQGDALLGGREQRQLNRKRLGAAPARTGEDEDAPVRPRRYAARPRHKVSGATAPRKTKVTLTLPCTVRSFSEAAGVPVQQVLRSLLGMGTMANINAEMEPETAELMAVEMGIEIDFKREVNPLDDQLQSIAESPDDPDSLQPRPPVITFLGHVDHGKTSLLDKIIGIDVVSGESGGITQHIRAYEIDRNGRKISFVDTPGHEAFTEMRARGANVTDVAVLVVAADDGVMPQTEEAINHARAANVPIVVALNKIDLPGIDIDRIYQQLATNNLLPTEWGGDTEVVKTSAHTGKGIDDLIETLLTIAELHDYRANPNRAAYGTCLEAELHEGRGVVAKVIVQKGTLRIGDSIVCGDAYGRVKAMYDTLKPSITYQEAGPSTPVNITGFDVAPAAGEHFFAIDSIATAREIAERRQQQNRRAALGGVSGHVTLETLFDRLGQDEVQTLNIILRADVRGSIEAIQKELTKLEHPEVKIKVLQAMVGGITEADVYLAHASDAIIIGFNVVPDEGARALAERQGIQIRRYEIIYKLTEDLKAALEGMLKPEQREMELGRVLVQRTFVISRVGTIAGCRVLSGTVSRNSRVRLIRENRIIGDYSLESLKREKDDAKEVREGMECGIKLAGYNDVKEGDIFEAYRIEEVARTF